MKPRALQCIHPMNSRSMDVLGMLCSGSGMHSAKQLHKLSSCAA